MPIKYIRNEWHDFSLFVRYLEIFIIRLNSALYII